MSAPRILLAPTHRTGLADAVAACVSEVLLAQGFEVRYHHVGPLAPLSAWDRWEGAVFVDPSLTGERSALSLYEVAVRHADISILSCTAGVLDRQVGSDYSPAEVAALLDCPLVVLMDAGGWGTGIKALISGIKAHLTSADLAGVILTGVADPDHYSLLKQCLAEEDVRLVGCLYAGHSPDWGSAPPGPWGLPLDPSIIEYVSTNVDIGGLRSLAGQRGFLTVRDRLPERTSDEGPLVMVAGGEGFTTWSRDSVEILRAAGARVQRVDLMEDAPLPQATAGLVLAGTLWPENVQEISMNTTLWWDIAERVGGGMPTVALGGGMLTMLVSVQDTLGRRSEFAGLVPAQAEILWDLTDPVFVEMDCLEDNVLLAKEEKVAGWVLTETELSATTLPWRAPLLVRSAQGRMQREAGYGGPSLLCSPALIHLASAKGSVTRFVRHCEEYIAAVRRVADPDRGAAK